MWDGVVFKFEVSPLAAEIDFRNCMCRLVLAFVVYLAVGIGYRVTVLGVSGFEVYFCKLSISLSFPG